MPSMQKIIEQKINDSLSPDYLEVINDSNNHKGHNGDDGSGQSHFLVKVRSEKFSGMSKLASYRMLNDILAEELKSLHSLSFSILP